MTSPWGDKIDLKRIAIFSYLSLRKEIDTSTCYMLRSLKDSGFSIVFVSRGHIHTKVISGIVDKVITQTCINSHFSSWASAFNNFPALYGAEEIVLTHDGVFGPMGNLSESHSIMQERDCDVWGAVHNACDNTLRTHYLVFKRTAVSHALFRNFFKSILASPVALHEKNFHEYMLLSGLKKDSLCRALNTTVQSSHPELDEWRKMITGGGLFIDKKTFLDSSRFDESGWTSLVTWAGYPIQHIADYFAARSLDISATIPVGRRSDPWPPNLLAMKIYPFSKGNDSTPSTTKIGAFVHVFYTEIFKELIEQFQFLPEQCDIYISTDTKEKADFIKCQTKFLRNKVFIQLAENKGFDIYPFLCIFKEKIFAYDIILKIHAKKSWHMSEEDSSIWRRSLFASLVGSHKRVSTILNLFQTTPELGMITPGFFNTYIHRLELTTDYDALQPYFKRMGFTPQPTTILDFPMGSMFWCRPAALKQLFDIGFSKKEFSNSDNELRGGTVAHLIERLFLFSCAASGFRWARILPDHHAFIQTNTISPTQNDSPLKLPVFAKILYDTGVMPNFADDLTPPDLEILYIDYLLFFRNEFPQKISISKSELNYLQQQRAGYPVWLELFAKAESRRQTVSKPASSIELFVRMVLRRKLNIESLLTLITPEFENILFNLDNGKEFRYCCETIVRDERPDILEGANTPLAMRLAFLRWWISYGITEYPLLFKYYIEQSLLTKEETSLERKGVPFAIQLVYWTRPDLQNAFPGFPIEKVLHWWNGRGSIEYPALSKYVTHSTVALNHPTPYKFNATYTQPAIWGANIIGLAKAELGIAEDTRMAANALKSRDFPFSINDAPVPTCSRQMDLSMEQYIKEGLPHLINIAFLPAIEILRILASQGADYFKGRYTICNWQWELPYWPTALNHCFAFPQEIWAPTQYIYDALEPVSPVPLFHMPMAVELPFFTKRPREYFSLPSDAFCFLFVFDGFSWPERKNPKAAVDAFHRAFPNEEQVHLVIKCMNCTKQTQIFCDLVQAADKDKRIHIINTVFSRADTLALFNTCDTYISLHRAEGFGRTITEAMLLGKPVIVSNFSGNLDFCNERNSFLVDGRKVPVREGQYPYYDGQYWFDPSIDDAADKMRICFYDRERTILTSSCGQSTIANCFSLKEIGKRYIHRLKQLQSEIYPEHSYNHLHLCSNNRINCEK